MTADIDKNVFPGPHAEVQNEFVRTTIDREQYSQGDTAILTIQNISGQTLGYNFCPVFLEKKIGHKWNVVADPLLGYPTEYACNAMLMTLATDSSARVIFPLERSLKDGTYHIVIPSAFPYRGEFTGYDALNSATFTVKR